MNAARPSSGQELEVDAVDRPHERRVRLLETLASLLGCPQQIGTELPDRRRPDVLRLDVHRRILFLADAKDTESPGNLATQARLAAYFRWVRAHERAGGVTVFAICFGTQSDADRWVETVRMLAHEVGVAIYRTGMEKFGPGLLIVWCVVAGEGKVPLGPASRRAGP